MPEDVNFRSLILEHSIEILQISEKENKCYKFKMFLYQYYILLFLYKITVFDSGTKIIIFRVTVQIPFWLGAFQIVAKVHIFVKGIKQYQLWQKKHIWH
jgi:hypothetical protein